MVFKSHMEELEKLHNTTKKELESAVKEKGQLMRKNNEYRRQIISS